MGVAQMSKVVIIGAGKTGRLSLQCRGAGAHHPRDGGPPLRRSAAAGGQHRVDAKLTGIQIGLHRVAGYIDAAVQG